MAARLGVTSDVDLGALPGPGHRRSRPIAWGRRTGGDPPLMSGEGAGSATVNPRIAFVVGVVLRSTRGGWKASVRLELCSRVRGTREKEFLKAKDGWVRDNANA